MTFTQNKELFFVIIDDDHLNNVICQTIIEKHYPLSTCLSFLDPNKAIEYLQNTINKQPDVILLDIHMPDVDGWKFLESFKKMDIVETSHIVMISSSINHKDVRGAYEHPLVKSYIEKPITIDKMNQALENLFE
ncbi:MAG: response regulator [Raineya sp.]|jgi:response regulator of citrate/malate metabolism|nr:response regulator [Raineya sp.]